MTTMFVATKTEMIDALRKGGLTIMKWYLCCYVDIKILFTSCLLWILSFTSVILLVIMFAHCEVLYLPSCAKNQQWCKI